MTKNEEKLNKINKCLWIVVLFTVAFNIIFLMRYNFEADSAFFVTLAQEQIRTKSLFPEGMYYSTGLFIFTPNLLMIPFLFITDNLVLARQLVIWLLWGVIYFILYKIFIIRKEKDLIGFILASSLFSVLYVDASVVSMHFYQGAYITYIIYQLTFLALMNKMITENAYTTKRFLAIVLLYVVANLGEMRNLLIWGIPGVIAYIIYVYINNNKQLEVPRDISVIKHLKVLCAAVLLAFVLCVIVTKMFGADGSVGVIVLPAKALGRSLNAIITGLFSLYGNSYEAMLLSFGGVLKFLNFLIAIFMNITVPIFAIKNINKLQLQSSKFIVIFSLTSNLVYFFVTFLTGAAIIEDRYLIPIYNNNILVLAVMGSFVLKNQLKKYLSVGLCCVLCYVLLCNCFYLGCQKESWMHHKFGTFAQGVEGVIEFLNDRGLQYGYATFFNAEEYSILSNNSVVIRGIQFDENRITPYYWLTSSHFYKPEYYSGKTFLMISDSEMQSLFPNGISKLDLGEPIEVLKFKRFTIFVYDYNISSKFATGKKVYYLIRG